MVISNLNTLLAQRGLSAAKVSKDTGISRTTLGALTSNTAQGVQFDTLNTLCTFLKVGPERILNFWPVDLSYELSRVKHEEIDEGSMKRGTATYEITISYFANGKRDVFIMFCVLDYLLSEPDSENDDLITTCIESSVEIMFKQNLMESLDDIPSIVQRMQSIPEDFLFYFQSQIHDEIVDEFPIIKRSKHHTTYWPFDKY